MTLDLKSQKARARLQAKRRRMQVHNVKTDRVVGPAGVGDSASALIKHFPALRFRGLSVGGYWPLSGEIDIRPLLHAAFAAGHPLALPCTPRVGKPLIFRAWQPSDLLRKGSFKTREPFPDQPEMFPQLLLMPLLAFSPKGDRLGYGGGFYDRTLAGLRARGPVYACGVAYSAQGAQSLPCDEFDQPLDGILTERYFHDFGSESLRRQPIDRRIFLNEEPI